MALDLPDFKDFVFTRNPRGIVATVYEKLKDALNEKITADRLSIFQSTEQTGNGSSQSIAHGLGVAPSKVIIALSSIPSGGASYTYTTSATNVNVTATNNAKYFVMAIA